MLLPLLEDLRATFRSGRTRSVQWRREQLAALSSMLRSKGHILVDALREDLRKPRFECWAGELRVVIAEANHALEHLERWMAPEAVVDLGRAGTGRVVREPLGLVLVIGPWNYPVQLVLRPLVGAIAAGNVAVLKPSELTPNTSRALAGLVRETLDSAGIAVVEGGAAEAASLLEHPFDHVFFTGGQRVGRAVLEAAAKHLTPVTLELGGKSPCIVLPDADLARAAERIVWGKFLNAGQVCVAPDYVLADASIEAALFDELTKAIHRFFGADPRSSADYGRIVDRHHYLRLVSLLDGVDVAHGGGCVEAERYIAPTLLRDVPPTAAIMQEEIFGPILPILKVDGLDDALRFVNARPKPLAMYLFSSDDDARRRAIEESSSGGLCINDTVVHIVSPELPFGGVGAAGMGSYHGQSSFLTFSHRKTVFEAPRDARAPGRFPPYSDRQLDVIQRLA